VQRVFAGTQVAAAWLVGSRAQGRERPDSDTDLAILLEPSDSWSYREEAGLSLALEEGGVDRPDLRLLNHAALSFQAEAVLRGRRVFCRDAATCVAYEVYVTTRYLDFEPILRLQYRIQRRRIQAEGILGPASRH